MLVIFNNLNSNWAPQTKCLLPWLCFTTAICAAVKILFHSFGFLPSLLSSSCSRDLLRLGCPHRASSMLQDEVHHAPRLLIPRNIPSPLLVQLLTNPVTPPSSQCNEHVCRPNVGIHLSLRSMHAHPCRVVNVANRLLVPVEGSTMCA